MHKERNNKWLMSFFGWSFFLLFFACGCADRDSTTFTDAELQRISLAQRIRLEEQAGGLVRVVGGEAITSEDVIRSTLESGNAVVQLIEVLTPEAKNSNLEQFKRQAKARVERIVTNKISDILIYHLAKSRAGDQLDEALNKAAEAELRRFILGFGGDEAKADEQLKQMGMDRKSFKKRQKRMMLAHSEIMSKLSGDSPVTYRELLDGYNQMKDEHFVVPVKVQFRLIDIQPDKLELADPNSDSKGLAGKLAYRLLEQIKAGKDFGELAKQYSHGPMSRFGGLWRPVQPQSLAEPYNALLPEIEKTEPGDVSNLVETPEHIFIIKIEQKQPKSYKPLQDVQRQVEKKIKSDKWNVVIARLNEGLTQYADLGEKDEFIDFCLEKIFELSRQ